MDAWFLTRDDYIRIFKDKVRLGNHPWPYIALNALVRHCRTAPFIEELKAVPFTTRPEDFQKSLLQYWPEVQEATGKFLTAVSQDNELSLLSLYWQMVEKICVALSLLNERPYTTRATIFEEALSFPILPPSFSRLMLKPDQPRIPSRLAERPRPYLARSKICFVTEVMRFTQTVWMRLFRPIPAPGNLPGAQRLIALRAKLR